MLNTTTNQLNNITNSLSTSKPWRKTENQPSRTSLREAELQQKLKQSTLRDKENVHTSENKKLDIQLTEAEVVERKKIFAKCNFYLDNIEGSALASIERGIKILGASQERFFSNKCTHLITNKHIPIQENLLQSKNNSNVQKKTNFVPKDTIIENAINWNITLWSTEVMMNTLEHFIQTSRFNKTKRAQEKRGLGKVLLDEKLFGPSTGANSESQSKRPQFIPFTGHYLIVEDAAQMHRPIIARQYTKQVFKQRQSEYPWPTLKQTEGCISPFGKRTQPKKNDTAEKASPVPTLTTTATPAAVAHISPMTPNQTAVVAGMATPPATPPVHSDSHQNSLRASGFQASGNTTQIQSVSTRSVSTSIQIDTTASTTHRKVPTGELHRLDKRMVENITQNEHQKLQKQALKEQMRRESERARREREKKKELRYCENCNCQFEKLEEHMNDPTHQTFIRDQNNFSQLDAVLETTRRGYIHPLPERWKNLIDPNIDGKNIKFMPSEKRSRTPSSSGAPLVELPNKSTTIPSIKRQKLASNPTTEPEIVEPEQKQTWAKYGYVFH